MPGPHEAPSGEAMNMLERLRDLLTLERGWVYPWNGCSFGHKPVRREMLQQVDVLLALANSAYAPQEPPDED